MKKRFELIEKYIDNELSSEERKKVDAFIANDTEFAKEYQLRVAVNKAIVEKDILTLRKSLDEIYILQKFCYQEYS